MMIRRPKPWAPPTPAMGVCLLALSMLGAVACGDAEPPAEQPVEETGEPTPGDAGPDGTTSLVAVEAVEPGEECAAGGFRVLTGVDEDGDGVLSAEEAGAGTELVQCDADGESSCGDAIAIESVDATSTDFAVGTAATLKVTVTPGDEAADARFILLGGDFDITPGAESGEFSVTPRVAGGPFTLTAVATNRCSVDNADFVIDEVLPMTGS